jgi:hypothetical protein
MRAWLAMGKGGRAVHESGLSIRFMDGRCKGLVGLECLGCLERLEAFPTPSSAVTGMKRGGSLAGPSRPSRPFCTLAGMLQMSGLAVGDKLHGAHRLSAPPCSAMCWIVRFYGLHGLACTGCILP